MNDLERERIYFPPESTSTELNVANTVLVNDGDGVWMLAYVQDIDGDSVFLNYMYSAIPPSWIHSKYIWPHDPIGHDQLDTSVYAAVRKERNGAFVFHPATLLSAHNKQASNVFDVYRMKLEKLCYVKMEIVNDNGEMVTVTTVIHRWQVIRKLPTTEHSASARNCYAKHQMEWSRADLEGRMDWYSLRLLIERHVSGTVAGYSRLLSDRQYHYFVRIERGTVTFVIGHSQINCKRIINTFREAVKHFEKLDNNPNDQLILPGSQSDTLTEETVYAGELPMDIWEDIFVCLDIQSRMRLKRVCRLWNSVFTTSRIRAAVHVLIDVGSLRKFAFHWHRSIYQFRLLLDKAVTTRTTALTLANAKHDLGFFMALAIDVLETKKAQLSVLQLQIKDCRVTYKWTDGCRTESVHYKSNHN